MYTVMWSSELKSMCTFFYFQTTQNLLHYTFLSHWFQGFSRHKVAFSMWFTEGFTCSIDNSSCPLKWTSHICTFIITGTEVLHLLFCVYSRCFLWFNKAKHRFSVWIRGGVYKSWIGSCSWHSNISNQICIVLFYKELKLCSCYLIF